MALEEFTESQLIEKLPWIPWCHCELKSKPASLPGSLLSGSPKNIAYLQRLAPWLELRRNSPLVVLTRLSIAHYFIIMCHLWVWPANNHQWKEETKSKSAHYSLHSSKNIPFEKQIIFFRSHTFDYHKFKQSNEKPLLHLIKIHKIFQTKFSKNSFSNVFIDTCVQIILPPIFCRCTQREKKRGVHSTLLTLSFAVDQKCGVKKACLIDAIIIKFRLLQPVLCIAIVSEDRGEAHAKTITY